MPIAKDAEQLEVLWCAVDVNHNGKLSLAEISNMVFRKFHLLNHRPALVHAYEHTTLNIGDGDPWVEIEEFPYLLVNLFHFNQLYQTYEVLTHPTTRVFDLDGFKDQLPIFGMNLTEAVAKSVFESLDVKQTGSVPFDDICIWYLSKQDKDMQVANSATELKARNKARKAMKKALRSRKFAAVKKTIGVPRLDSEGYSNSAFDEFEKEVLDFIRDVNLIEQLWDIIDYDDNYTISLNELNKALIEELPVLKHKAANDQAYRQVTKKSGNGDDLVEAHQLPLLLVHMLYCNRMYQCFEEMDHDGDRHIDVGEFQASVSKLGMVLTEQEVEAEFAVVDADGSGAVHFDEFCDWYSNKHSAKTDVSAIAEALKGRKNAKSVVKNRRILVNFESPELKDQGVNLRSRYFDALENELLCVVRDSDRLEELWDAIDLCGSALQTSIADVQKVMAQRYPLLANEQALLKAYQWITLADRVELSDNISVQDFPHLMINTLTFSRIFTCVQNFTVGEDRHFTKEDFYQSVRLLGTGMSKKEALAEFENLDLHGSRSVPFDVFASWYAKKRAPGDSAMNAAEVVQKRKSMKRKVKKKVSSSSMSKRDDGTGFNLKKYERVEKETVAIAKDPTLLEMLWLAIDPGASQRVSLTAAEAVLANRFPDLGNKASLALSYQHAAGKMADNLAFVEAQEFSRLLFNMVHIGKVCQCFNVVTVDSIRPVSKDKFAVYAKKLGMRMTVVEAKNEFDKLTSDGDNEVFFNDFCIWYVGEQGCDEEVNASGESLRQRLAIKRDAKSRATLCAPLHKSATNFHASVFAPLEDDILDTLLNPDKLEYLWDVSDIHDDGKVSLAKFDHILRGSYPQLDSKPALLTAFKFTTGRNGGTKKAWVSVNDFAELVLNVFYYNTVFKALKIRDTAHGGSVDKVSFGQRLKVLGTAMDASQVESTFTLLDPDGSGTVPYSVFAEWYVKQYSRSKELAQMTALLKERKKAKRNLRAGSKSIRLQDEMKRDAHGADGDVAPSLTATTAETAHGAAAPAPLQTLTPAPLSERKGTKEVISVPKLKSFEGIVEDEVDEFFPFSERVNMANSRDVSFNMVSDPDAVGRLWSRLTTIGESLLAICRHGLYIVDTVTWTRTRIGSLKDSDGYRASCWVGETAVIFFSDRLCALTPDGELRDIAKGSWDNVTSCTHMRGHDIAVACGDTVHVCNASDGSFASLCSDIGGPVRQLMYRPPARKRGGQLICITDDSVLAVADGEQSAKRIAHFNGADTVITVSRIEGGALFITPYRTRLFSTSDGKISDLESADWGTVSACVTTGIDTVVAADDYGLNRINVRTGSWAPVSDSDNWKDTLALMACPLGFFSARETRQRAPPPLYKVSNLLHRTFPALGLTDAAVFRAHDCAIGVLDIDDQNDKDTEKRLLEEGDLLNTVTYSFCFATLNGMFPDKKLDKSATIDISEFSQVCRLSHNTVSPSTVTEAFESMESNDGAGNVLLAEVATWLGQTLYLSSASAIRRNPSLRHDSKALINSATASLSDPDKIWAAWMFATSDSPALDACSSTRCGEWVRDICKELYDEQTFRHAFEVASGGGEDTKGPSAAIAADKFVDTLTAFAAIAKARFLSGIDDHGKISQVDFPKLVSLLSSKRSFSAAELDSMYRSLGAQDGAIFGNDFFRWFAQEQLQQPATSTLRSEFAKRLGDSCSTSMKAALLSAQSAVLRMVTDPVRLDDVWENAKAKADGIDVKTFAALMRREFPAFADERILADQTAPLFYTLAATATATGHAILQGDFPAAIARTCTFTVLRWALERHESEAAFVEPVTLKEFLSAADTLGIGRSDAQGEYSALRRDADGEDPLLGDICEWYTDRVLPVDDINAATAAFSHIPPSRSPTRSLRGLSERP
mmetsp:Transcript_30142/g.90310  ORF Transcript_30142/g.90310 Transcript_30142/m.90310 type:complete len:1889 (-) Transcript_30142:203-5869(-)